MTSGDLYLGDCREVRTVLADSSVDSIITDPPYGLEFMGKGWDKGVPSVEFWKEFLAVAKPGAALLAFGGTRTFHRMACAIEDAGWEMRDCMMWLYGSGFPKSLDIAKVMDKNNGHWRARAGALKSENGAMAAGNYERTEKGDPITDLAKQWNGWGTALKPAWEPIIVAMKPLDGTFAENAERWGVAGLNIDGGRIPTEEMRVQGRPAALGATNMGGVREGGKVYTQGRWPANLILDEEAGKMLDEQKSGVHFADKGGASRFFYCTKASPSERNTGCGGLELKAAGGMSGRNDGSMGSITYNNNNHPTVKPLKLMEYLCLLTKTPTGGIVLDPFAGSGTTLLAARNTGRRYIGIEQNPEYMDIIEWRLGLK